MQITQLLENPQLFSTLTDQQRIQVYQDILKYQQQLEQQKIRTQAQLEEKQKQQQDLLKELQSLTNLTTLQDIQKYIESLKQQFDTELQQCIDDYNKLGGIGL